ncbi:MAG: amidohydrolase family protein, partial [Vicinamibacterales bacterium]
TMTGGVMGAAQRITRQEALRLATINNARLMFEESIKGSIETGKVADLVVLGEDILTSPEARIRDAEVVMTMAGGRIVYSRDGWPSAAPAR